MNILKIFILFFWFSFHFNLVLVIYNSEEGFQHLTEEGRATMERLNQMLLAGQHQRDSGAGDADIVNRTDQMHITNGKGTVFQINTTYFAFYSLVLVLKFWVFFFFLVRIMFFFHFGKTCKS